MKRFVLWCKWLANGRYLATALRHRIENLERQPQRESDALKELSRGMEQRTAAIEKALTDMQAAHAEEMHEIRERLDGRIRRNSPHRTFQQMRSVAEMGERVAAAKREEQHA